VPVDPGHIEHLSEIFFQSSTYAVRARRPVVCFLVTFAEQAFHPVDVVNVFIDVIVAVLKADVADDEHEAGDAECKPENVDE
jgi:hypothetical protein